MKTPTLRYCDFTDTRYRECQNDEVVDLRQDFAARNGFTQRYDYHEYLRGQKRTNPWIVLALAVVGVWTLIGGVVWVGLRMAGRI